MNKLIIEDQFLTIDQAKELQALGIDFSGANMFVFFDGRIISKNEAEFMTIACNSSNVALPIILPILSVAEMIEMLPKYLNFGTTTTILAFRPYPLGGGWIITYSEGQNSLIRQKIKVDGLLRDALFEMIKWIKQNKLI